VCQNFLFVSLNKNEICVWYGDVLCDVASGAFCLDSIPNIGSICMLSSPFHALSVSQRDLHLKDTATNDLSRTISANSSLLLSTFASRTHIHLVCRQHTYRFSMFFTSAPCYSYSMSSAPLGFSPVFYFQIILFYPFSADAYRLYVYCAWAKCTTIVASFRIGLYPLALTTILRYSRKLRKPNFYRSIIWSRGIKLPGPFIPPIYSVYKMGYSLVRGKLWPIGHRTRVVPEATENSRPDIARPSKLWRLCLLVLNIWLVSLCE